MGLCTLISLREIKPPVLNELSNRILPSIILLFDGLRRAYECRKQEGPEEEEEEEENDKEEECDST